MKIIILFLQIRKFSSQKNYILLLIIVIIYKMKSDALPTHPGSLRQYASPTIWVNTAQLEVSLLGESDPDEELHTTIVDDWAQEDARSNLWSGFDEEDTSDYDN